jgi:hypothetical protein
MRAQRIIGCLLLASAYLVGFSHIYWWFSMPPHSMLPVLRDHYFIKSSIETFGFAIPAIVIGFYMLRRQAKYRLWFALVVAGAGLWLFVVRVLWLHFYYLPHKYPQYLEDNPYYFSGPLYLDLIRMSWHILLPATFVLSVILLLRRTPDNSPEPS